MLNGPPEAVPGPSKGVSQLTQTLFLTQADPQVGLAEMGPIQWQLGVPACRDVALPQVTGVSACPNCFLAVGDLASYFTPRGLSFLV